jgi:hypothetical protein
MHTRVSNPGADTSSAIVSAGKGPQETLDRESEIRTWGGAGADGGAELLASQAPQEEDDDGPDKVEDEEEPQEEDDGDQATVEDQEESATVEWESEGEHEEDEEASDTEEGESEGERVLTVMRSFLSRRPPRRSTMSIQTRWRKMKHLPPRKKPGRRTTRGTSDTNRTEKSTSGLSIKLLCKIPCLPISKL